MATGPSDLASSSAEVPFSQVTLVCVQLTKGTQHRRQLLKVFLTCAKIVYEWDLKNVTIAHAVDGVLTGLLLIFLHISSLRFHQRKSGFKLTVIYLFSYITDTWRDWTPMSLYFP